MGRPPRAEPTSVPLHVIARGVRRQRIFDDEDDYESYVALFGRAARRFDWIVLGFSLMPNHVHLVLRLKQPTLSKGMQWLHSKHARQFNLRHGYQGHAFDARFFGRAIETEDHLFRVLSYVAMNPVLAGLCQDPADWRWSSFACVAGESDDHPFVAARRVRVMYGGGQAAGARGYASAIRSAIVDEMFV